MFFSMATSSGDDTTRGTDFQFSRNRLNIAISRAHCLAYPVCTDELLNTRVQNFEDMRLISTLSAFLEYANTGWRLRVAGDRPAMSPLTTLSVYPSHHAHALCSNTQNCSAVGGIRYKEPRGGRSGIHMADGYPIDEPSHTWLDAFPWLAAAAGPASAPWWNEAINDPGERTRYERLATVSKLALERLTRWTIGEVFPGLPPDLEIPSLRLPTRASNAIMREGYRVAADLSDISLDMMTDWRNVGVNTIDVILQALAGAAMQHATPLVTRAQPPATIADRPTAAPNRQILPIIDDLIQIARWYVTLGVPEHRLLEQQLPAGAPAGVLAARRRLTCLHAADVLGRDPLATDVVQLFEDALAKLNSRAVEILGDRLFADNPVTLDELGRRYDVTRERVRQIEAVARGALLGIIAEDGPLASLAQAARTQIGLILPLDELLRRIPSLGKRIESVAQPAWRVLDRLDDAYEIEDGWCVLPTVTAVQATTQAQLQEQADQHGVVRLDDLTLIERNLDSRSELTASWLTYCGYIVDGDFVLTRTNSVGDYAAAVLSLAGTPLGAQEIIDRFAFERNAGSLRNAMSSDDRFERVDRDRWALKEWGMETYSGIRSLIREQIAANGGQIRLNDLIEFITGRYSVSASSVSSYASLAPFQLRDGMVRVAGTDRTAGKAPARTRRLFRRSDGWAYRVRITKDHLRGSGSVAPMAIASVLGLKFGDTLHLESPLGPQSIAWTGTQPSFGTVRRFLMDADIAAGTDAFLVINDDGTFSFEPARMPIGDPLADALSLIGAPMCGEPETARAAVATALTLPTIAPISSLIGACRDRGDTDIAELLTSVRNCLEVGHTPQRPERNAQVDEILDLL